jgi:hypothetical protein
MSNWDRKLRSAFVASKEIFLPRSSAHRAQSRTRFAFDPTTGALIVDPDLDLKIRKALLGEARSITRRLYLNRLLG